MKIYKSKILLKLSLIFVSNKIRDIASKMLFKSLSLLVYLNFLIINFNQNKIGDIATKVLCLKQFIKLYELKLKVN